MQRFFRALLHAGEAFSGIVLYPKQGKIAGGFQGDRHGTEVLAECTVILKSEGQKVDFSTGGFRSPDEIAERHGVSLRCGV